MLEEVLEFLSPATCVGCKRPGAWLCRKCNLELEPTTEQVCPSCLAASTTGQVCSNCRRLRVPLDQLISCCAYESRMFHRVLAAYKEDGNRNLQIVLGRRMVATSRWHVPTHVSPVVIPVPCSRTRARLRGFDQAELLARYIARSQHLTLEPSLLQRIKHRGTQKNLGIIERRSSLKSTYRIVDTGSALNQCRAKGVLLVDDVATTLATLETCAMALRAAGVRQVRALVLAHAALT